MRLFSYLFIKDLFWAFLPFYYDRTVSRQEAKWKRVREDGIGKLGSPELPPRLSGQTLFFIIQCILPVHK